MDIDAKFCDYKRVTDTLLYLDPNYSLTFTTVLSFTDKNGCDSFFQSEWLGQDGGISIYRQIRFYYVIQEKNTFGGGFLLHPNDVYFFCKTIEEKVFPWFFGDTCIFQIKEDKLYKIGNYSNVQYIRSMEQFLNIYPIVYSFRDGEEKEGVRIYINSEDKYMDIDIDKLVQLYYVLKTTDMMNYAANALSYAKIGPFGKDLIKSSGGLGGMSSGKTLVNKWDKESTPNKLGNVKFKPSNFLKNANKKKEEE